MIMYPAAAHCTVMSTPSFRLQKSRRHASAQLTGPENLPTSLVPIFLLDSKHRKATQAFQSHNFYHI